MLPSLIFDHIETDFFILGVSVISSFFSSNDWKFIFFELEVSQTLSTLSKSIVGFFGPLLLTANDFSVFWRSSASIFLENKTWSTEKKSKILKKFLLSAVVNRNVHLRVQETHCKNWDIECGWKKFSIRNFQLQCKKLTYRCQNRHKFTIIDKLGPGCEIPINKD